MLIDAIGMSLTASLRSQAYISRHGKILKDRSETPLGAGSSGCLAEVKDPDLHKDIVTLNFVKDLKVDAGKASFTIELTTPACPVKKQMEQWAREAVLKVNGVREVEIRMSARVTAGQARRRQAGDPRRQEHHRRRQRQRRRRARAR